MAAMTPTTDQTPSAERLLAAARGGARTPVLLIDLQRVEDRYRELRAAFAEAEVLYAVKANPQPEILARLAGLGCGFDIASPGELALSQALGRPNALLSYGNPAKKEADIAAAHAAGVGLFAFDSQMELEKLARAAPGAATVCRLSVSGAGAQWPLTHKFGCTVDQAVALLVEARRVGLKPAGIAFHVGSQQTQPEAWRHAIHRAGEVFRLAARAGVSLEFLNLGGGLPAHYSTPVAPLAAYVEVMRAAVAASFGASPPRLIIEPGRYMVGDAGALVTEVVLVADRPHERVRRWVYVDAGVFSGSTRPWASASATGCVSTGRSVPPGRWWSPVPPATAPTSSITTGSRRRWTSPRASAWSSCPPAPTPPPVPASASTASRR